MHLSIPKISLVLQTAVPPIPAPTIPNIQFGMMSTRISESKYEGSLPWNAPYGWELEGGKLKRMQELRHISRKQRVKNLTGWGVMPESALLAINPICGEWHFEDTPMRWIATLLTYTINLPRQLKQSYVGWMNYGSMWIIICMPWPLKSIWSKFWRTKGI